MFVKMFANGAETLLAKIDVWIRFTAQSEPMSNIETAADDVMLRYSEASGVPCQWTQILREYAQDDISLLSDFLNTLSG